MLGRWLRSTPWRESSIWALDLETSGLDPRTDLILSAGMVPVREGRIRWGERYYSLVRAPLDHRPSPNSLRIHHILPEEADGAPELPQVLEEIRSRVDGAVTLVHYGKLDLGFLREAGRRLATPWPGGPVVDTLRLLGKLSFARRRLDPYAESLPAGLGEACEELGLPLHVRHHALYDALATAELFLVLAERLGARTLRHLQ